MVVVDGGSTDGTWERLSQWVAPFTVTLLRVPGASISAGRNIAMSRARCDVIAITDAGTVADENWLLELLRPFEDPTVDISSGFFRPALNDKWQRSLAAATLPDVEDIHPGAFLPSSRSVAVRSAWVRRGFEYPEWLDYCEDLVWDLQLKRGGACFTFTSEATVEFSVRPNWPSFWRQYYLYARGDGKAGLFAKRHALRYLSYFAGAIVLARGRRVEVSAAGLLSCAYIYKPVVRLARRDRAAGVPLKDTFQELTLIPIHRLVGDVAKMVGYPVGLFWRWRRCGKLGPATSWGRIRPDGTLWHPESTAGETRRPEA